MESVLQTMTPLDTVGRNRIDVTIFWKETNTENMLRSESVRKILLTKNY